MFSRGIIQIVFEKAATFSTYAIDLTFVPFPTIENFPPAIWRRRLYTFPRFCSPKITVGLIIVQAITKHPFHL
jgi:hypothetical protein